ncbi:TM2 domain-containing protein [Mycobacterium sp. pR1184]|uniref:TM2 domain-containing protein n=1 Tax=Mycobacterium sp. pR1184 TaxID=3238981 RepID=UPI00351B6132
MLNTVTEPSWGSAPDPGAPPPQPSGYPPPYPQYQPYPGAAGYDPSAPYGRHPVTGLPYSDKSKTIAGLLQLLSLVGIGGIGRFYIGDTGIGVAQLLLGLCGIGLIWSIIDAVLILTDKVNDPQGRPLRDGT